ncbi:MAG TPA: hypothetical protein VK003_01955 [Oceanobacillus sp.]|nr:hypothetical protein [Oceanobacillus sp.]
MSGSCIAGNTVGSGSGSGISNPDSGTADAENNWWGASGGANTSGADTTLGSVDYTPFLTSAPASCDIEPNPTPTPTPSPTPGFCPGGFSSFTEEECPEAVLAEHEVTVEGCTAVEVDAILAGTLVTADALQSQFGGDPASDTFMRVLYSPMAMEPTSGIEFICDVTADDVPTAGCRTRNAPPGEGLQARILCGPSVVLTEYTVVHEYGHVFEGRMGGLVEGSTYFGLISRPAVTLIPTATPGTPGPLFDSSNLIVFGPRKDPDTSEDDWVRGQRGWGSAASTPPSVPCDFQQDAYTVDDWEVTLTPQQTQTAHERDEAAADMFLNWVYSEINQGGFHNDNYIGITNCSTTPTPDLTARPGDARYNYMETIVMPTLATRVPTATATP